MARGFKNLKVWLVALSAVLIIGASPVVQDAKSPPRDMQVDLDLLADGKPLHLSKVFHCVRHVTEVPGGSFGEYYLDPANRVFGHRLPDGSALLIWSPDYCQGALLKLVKDRDPKDGPINDNNAVRSDGRLAHIHWRPVPEGNLPLIGWIADSKKTDEILLYASPKAYENPKSRLKFVKLTFTNPDLGRPVDKPDEYAWLGTTQVVGRDPMDFTYSFYKLSGYYLLPLLDHRPKIAKLFWDKVDKNNKDVQYLEIHEPPVSGRDNADIDTAFFVPHLSGAERGFGLWGDYANSQKRVLDDPYLHDWIDGYPLRIVGDHFEPQMDMMGFIYVYDHYDSRVFAPADEVRLHYAVFPRVTNPVIKFPDGTIVKKPFGDSWVYFIPSLNQIFNLREIALYHHKPRAK